MFYTGVHTDPANGFRIQQMGLATSSDLTHWTRHGPPIFTVGLVPWAYVGSLHEAQFRDPFVMKDPTRAGGWLMYYVATCADRYPDMVVGVVQSDSGLDGTWASAQRPLVMTDAVHTRDQTAESPHVFFDRGRWLLFFSTHSGNPISTELNAGAPLDASAADSSHWSVNTFHDYLADSSLDFVSAGLSSGWFATEYLQVGGREFFGACDGVGIRISEMHWRGTTPDYFALARPTAEVGEDGRGNDTCNGPHLTLVGTSPARGVARLRIALAQAGGVRLVLYDLSGRSVRTLVAGRTAAGQTIVVWDGRDRYGRRVGSGMYFARLISATGEGHARVPLLW